jgi:hypothetical protein
MRHALSTTAATTIAVTLNSFQGPFIHSRSGFAARWMLKQVQHDEVVQEVLA